MDLGNDGLPLLTYSDFFEYLMRWHNTILREGIELGTRSKATNLFCNPQQKAYLDNTNGSARFNQQGITDLVFNLGGLTVSVRPVTGHRGFTLAPAGPFLIPGPRGEDT